MTPLDSIPLNSPITEKISWARECHGRFGSRLLEDGAVSDLLRRLDQAVLASAKAMADAGIAHICRACDRVEGGACCGAGLENRYDGWLLLINLLLGATLPEERIDPRGCFFLGPSGCRLKARHVICVNYLCKKITERIDPELLRDLRGHEGNELDTLFRLHERVKQLTRQWDRRDP
jgi:hypothetical protein